MTIQELYLHIDFTLVKILYAKFSKLINEISIYKSTNGSFIYVSLNKTPTHICFKLPPTHEFTRVVKSLRCAGESFKNEKIKGAFMDA